MALGGRNCPYCRYYNALDEARCGRCARYLPPGPLAELVRLAASVELAATKTLGAVSCVVFALEVASSGRFGAFTGTPVSSAVRFGALLGTNGFVEPYRLLAACFVHFGVLHVAMNMLALADLGRALEPRIGAARFVLAYVVTGVLGFVASTYWYAGMPYPVPTAGASGAIFGLIGVILGDRIARRDPTWKSALVRTVVYSFVWWLVLHTNQAAHLGGLAAGVAVGFAYANEARPWKRDGLANLLAAISLVAIVLSILLPQRSPTWRRLRELERRAEERAAETGPYDD